MGLIIALLRAVNVGGRKLAMPELKNMLEALGFTDVRTVLQSGNTVFKRQPKTAAGLESLLESETEKRLGLRADYFVRTPAEWAAIIGANPFPREAKQDPGHLLLLPLKSEPAASDLEALRAAIRGREVVHLSRRELYAYYPDGIGASKLTLGMIERKLQTRCTGRNWNTVLKIQAAAASSADLLI